MQSFWIKGLEQEKNATAAFRKVFPEKTEIKLRIAGVSCYKIIADGKLIGFGPYRGAHGQSKVLCFTFEAKSVVVEVNAYHVKTYWLVCEPPFIALELTANRKKYTAADLECFILRDRVQQVQRYSFQRGFLEAYRIGQSDRYGFYRGEAAACFSDLLKPAIPVPVTVNRLIPSHLSHPKLEYADFGAPVEQGVVRIDPDRPVWRDRSMTLLDQIGGFEISQWQEVPTDEASHFTYQKDAVAKPENGERNYLVFGNGTALTGFFKVKVRVRKPGCLWLLYDELDFQEEKNKRGDGINVCFSRNTCANVVKWRFSETGEFTLDSFEPYTAGFIKTVFDEGIEIENVSLIRYENPDCGRFGVRIDDNRAQKIAEAAVSTFRQNAVDILTDCPSRERAGWLSDSFFSSETERILTGKNQREKAFLENYASHKPLAGTPKIVPMCYPADDYEGLYIPNWALWYILELHKYRKNHGEDQVVRKSIHAIRSVMDFFEHYENEYGLLENLEGWVFVEWSAANDKTHTAGVNAPSNALYYAALKAAAALLKDEKYLKKADRVKSNLLQLSFDGKLFVDNLIRNEQGELVKTQNYTEVCQYYFFYFGVASVKRYSETYAFLMNELGVRRKAGMYEHIGKSNAMYGIYMRLELLMREKNAEELYRECVAYFYPMALRTGTLWENASPSGSNVHGFASYVLKWLIYALTGYNGKKVENIRLAGTNAAFCLPQGRGVMEITVKDGNVQWTKTMGEETI